MRTRWAVCVLAFAMVGCSLSAFAGPRIVIGDPSCSSWNSDLYGALTDVMENNSFSFTANGNGGGYFGFCNQTGAQWTTVDFKFLSNTLPTIICDSDIYQSCDVSTITGGYEILFSDPTNPSSNSDPGGIPDGHYLSINLNTDSCVPTANSDCSSNDGDWPQGLSFYGGTNQPASIPTPEPATLALISAGAAGLWQYRRRK